MQWYDIVYRTLIAVFALFIFTKLLGKRQLTQMSMFEYITGITIGNMIGYISLDTDSAWYVGLAAIAVWALVSLGIQFLQIKSKRARDFIDGKGSVLIKDGKVMEDNLKKERLSIDELMEQLRKKSAFKVADVEFAIMEPGGDINVMLARENQPLTPRHLGIKVGPEQEPQIVVMDGKVMDEPLATLGLSRQWLNTELEKLGIAIENVFVGQVDSYGQLFVDLYDDQIAVPAPQKKATLFANLKKIEADITLFGLSTRNKQAKAMYERCAKQLQRTIDELTPILHR
ncbi:DUF421 domain-containing protein [Paenibacillaceae bacterium WGS1546]|uniref:DUF421 domain-containing protein n=1 Tax=Cohnella sp. WGS1546 TaxID=3366810 RepID=UPI00372D76B4